METPNVARRVCLITYADLVAEIWALFLIGGVCYVVFEAVTMGSSGRVKGAGELAYDAVRVWSLVIVLVCLLGGVMGFAEGFVEGFREAATERSRQRRHEAEAVSKSAV